MGVEHYEQPMFFSSTYKITVLHLSDCCATLIAAHVGYVYLHNQ